MFGLGAQELILILIIILIFFGADKIPKLAKSLGKGIGEFRKAQQEVKEELLKEAEPIESQKISQGNPTEPEPTKLICPSCQRVMVAGSLYCSQCGNLLSKRQVCSVCQRMLADDEKFCSNCGQSRKEKELG